MFFSLFEKFLKKAQFSLLVTACRTVYVYNLLLSIQDAEKGKMLSEITKTITKGEMLLTNERKIKNNLA